MVRKLEEKHVRRAMEVVNVRAAARVATGARRAAAKAVRCKNIVSVVGGRWEVKVVVMQRVVMVRGICEDGLILTKLENGSSFGCELANHGWLIISRDGRARSCACSQATDAARWRAASSPSQRS